MSQTKSIPTRKGKVIKKSSDKTIVVLVERNKKHFTGKVIKLHQKYLAHDENNLAEVDNFVKITEGKKVSKNKSWHLVEVLSNDGDN
jgi:small subunit ribosomal protein S17